MHDNLSFPFWYPDLLNTNIILWLRLLHWFLFEQTYKPQFISTDFQRQTYHQNLENRSNIIFLFFFGLILRRVLGYWWNLSSIFYWLIFIIKLHNSIIQIKVQIQIPLTNMYLSTVLLIHPCKEPLKSLNYYISKGLLK